MKRLLAILPISLLFAGCSMTGTYQSARVLEKGTSAFGLSFGSVGVEVKDSANVDSSATFSWPIIIPDVTFRTALSDHIEIGGKVSVGSLGLEGDLKWGFLQGERFCMAVAPALYGQNALFMKGSGFTLPVLASYDINETFSINGSVFSSFSRFSSDLSGVDSILTALVGDVNATGGSLGLEFSGKVFHIRPVIEVSRMAPLKPEEVDWQPFKRTRFVLHLGFVLGKEKKQLDRLEEKLDKSLEK